MSKLNWPEARAMTKKTTRIAIEMNDTTMAKRNDSAAPAALMATNTAYRMMYQSHIGSACSPSGRLSNVTKMLSAYDAEKKTMTAVVATYSIVSAIPVIKPPQGPMAARANE